ncbi:hypothetical protein H4R34_000428 [Dimargaris verticillata]|uniref:Calnexin n=1 Tax=Dimargaris verticillata TaxID=2761393 RepID=A0A9W8EEQ7_9FUNG|nr:hypothetical protein H4R34_000428 [Dimargaris verticillata]
MKYNLLALATLLALAAAKDENLTLSEMELQFKPTTVKGLFVEQFTDGLGRWTVSKAVKKEDGKESTRYTGQWEVEAPIDEPFLKGDQGLVLQSPAAHHAIAVPFDQPLVPGEKPLVVQYEVKLQNSLDCGGAYLKLVSQAEDKAPFDPSKFDNETPYTIMFGPDRCGPTNKVHFILRHKNPKTGEIVEKHLKSPPSARITKQTNLYTLIVQPDNTYDIRINNKSVSTGNLLEDMDPPINPPKEIDDPNDQQPDDWVTEAKIPDPEAKKPEDWDEDAPRRIPNAKAVKPADWLDNEPLEIPDPEDQAPPEWDAEEDGEYVARTIANPKCAKVSGCGPWEQPMMDNPDYKGKWYPPIIDNPAYKGEWKPRRIPNPDYFEDKYPAKMTPIVGLGFELWTMQSKIMFDNIYVGDSVDAAEQLLQETWSLKTQAESAKLLEEDKAKEAKDTKDEVVPEPSDFVNFARYQANKFVKDAKVFVETAQVDIRQAFTDQPRVAGVFGLLFLTLVWLFNTIIGMFVGQTPEPSAQRAAKAATKKDDGSQDASAVDAATTATGGKQQPSRRAAAAKRAAEDSDPSEE